MARNYRSVSGKGWYQIRHGLDQTRFDLKKMQTRVTNAPAQAAKGYANEIRKIAWRARELMQKIIMEAPNRTKGEPGRYDTGTMHKMVWANLVKNNDKSYSANVGWLAGKPGYAIFQEYGTRTGLVGMDALRQAQDFMFEEIRALNAGGRSYRTKTGWDWNASGAGGNDLGGAPSWYKG